MTEAEGIIRDYFLSARSYNGIGIFRGHRQAAEVAKGLTRNDIMKYRKQKLVPESLPRLLKKLNMLGPEYKVPTNRIKMEDFQKVLACHFIEPAPYLMMPDPMSEVLESLWAQHKYLRREQQQQQRLWEKIEFAKHLRGVRKSR